MPPPPLAPAASSSGPTAAPASAPPITERSALALARAIRHRELSAVDVVNAHIELLRTVAAQLNAVVADRFDAALDEARAADQLVASAEQPDDLPPLLGVPFSVKESIALEGMPHAAGLLARRAFRVDRTAPPVQRLRDAGAIPLGVTNTSELTLWIESSNQLYGRTANPYDTRRTAGGSSGGEGAVVGAGGAPFGVGSDIGGSIRLPAFFCGVFGHKPSPGVVPNSNLFPPSPPGDAAQMLAVGPIARRAEDLMPLLRTMAGPDPEDPRSRAVELRDPAAVSLSGLSVVTVEDASLLPISGELREARERAVGVLAAHGARIRRVSLRSWRRAALPFLATLQAGAGVTTASLLEEAGAAAPTWRALLRRRGPHTLPTRLALAAELQPQIDEARRSRLVETGRELARELVDAIGDGVLLHPAHPRVAPRHGATVGRPWLVTPAAVFNLAQVPVTEVPLGLNSRGLPLGVQVAGGRDRDEVCIAVALVLEQALGGWVPPWRAKRRSG